MEATFKHATTYGKISHMEVNKKVSLKHISN